MQAVAPELRPTLSVFPQVDFSYGLDLYRQPFDPAALFPLPEPLRAITCEEVFVPGASGAPDVRVLVYRPPDDGSERLRPAVLHMHGGGYVLGSPELNDNGNRAMTLALGVVVVSVDYRLAPETPWPGPLQDCYAVLSWLAAGAAELGIDANRIAIAGESAGGGHAAALALLARDKGGPGIQLQLLDSPMLDDRTGSQGDPHPCNGKFVWTAESNRFGWSALLGGKDAGDGVPKDAIPARTGDLTGLPPTFISVGALDLLLDESLEYTRRLARAGVPVELHVIPGAYHGFSLATGTPQVALMEDLRLKALARALGAELS